MIRHQRAIGAASLEIAAHGLVRLNQASPLRILFPTPEPGAALEAAFVNVAGGLAGGDSIRAGITLRPGARAQVTTPAAEKIYRSLGDASRIATRPSFHCSSRSSTATVSMAAPLSRRASMTSS